MEGISRPAKILFAVALLAAESASAQSLFLGGGYVLGNRAAGMSAYIADPDYAHSVLLNPAKLGYVSTIYVASDYQNFSRDVNQLFLPSTPTAFLTNGRMSAWDAALAIPLGPVGGGASFSAFDLGGWRTTSSAIGAGMQLPLGFSVGLTGKYVTMSKLEAIPGGTSKYELSRFTFDIGAMNQQVLADNTFFRAILSTGAVFTNVVPGATWSTNGATGGPAQNLVVDLPQTFGCGIAYTFASNYRLYDFELFRVTGAMGYSHVFSNSSPVDGFTLQNDQYRVGLETIALGVLAVRLGYTLKTPVVGGQDSYNRLSVASLGSGFSYGFSLRFPVKLVLPALPVTSLEFSYAKNPEWSSGIYHDLFGVVFELLF